MAEKPANKRSDRWADWAVIGLLVVALLLGSAVMVLAQGQRDEYTDAKTGLTVRYPQGWLLKPAESLAFRAVDPGAGGFKTTFEARVWPIDASGPTTPTLAVVLNNASLARAQQGTAYRLFDVVEGRPIDGQPAMEANYVYVVKSGDLFVQRMPVVVLGLDVAVARGERAYVFSLLAAQETFAEAEKAFRRFVESAELK